MRDAAINLRAKPEQRDLIDQAAAMLGKNRSDFMLEAACDRAQSVLLDQVYFRLDDRRLKGLHPPAGCFAGGQCRAGAPDGCEGALGRGARHEVFTLKRSHARPRAADRPRTAEQRTPA